MQRILLVDDDDSTRKVLRLMLGQLGHEVTEARNGLEAVAQYDLAPADLVITDPVMPGMDGIETILKFKQRNPRPKIIAISGGGRFNADELLAMAKHLGAQQILVKPLTLEQISAAILQVSS